VHEILCPLYGCVEAFEGDASELFVKNLVFVVKQSLLVLHDFAPVAEKKPDIDLDMSVGVYLTRTIPRRRGVHIRLKQRFIENGVTTLSDLLQLREADLLRMPSLGRKSVNELVHALADDGLELRPT